MGLGGAVTCPAHRGMHLRENHVIAEIVDEEGRVLPWGETGELVITTVGTEALPLIRYRTGDITRILPEPCPCGSELLRLDSLHRRGPAADMAALDAALFALDALIDYRAERGPEGLRIRALCCGALSEAQVAEAAAGVFPGEAVFVTLSEARPGDRALSPGKRRIEEGRQE